MKKPFIFLLTAVILMSVAYPVYAESNTIEKACQETNLEENGVEYDAEQPSDSSEIQDEIEELQVNSASACAVGFTVRSLENIGNAEVFTDRRYFFGDFHDQ